MVKIICLFILVISFALRAQDPEGLPACGLKGKIKERMKDCEKVTGSPLARTSSAKEAFSRVLLVRRNSNGDEIVLDKDSKSLWDDSVKVELNHLKALKYCENYRQITESEGMGNIKWRLPSKEEMKAAFISTAVVHENEEQSFWTDSAPEGSYGKSSQVIIINSKGEEREVDRFSVQKLVRCVADF